MGTANGHLRGQWQRQQIEEEEWRAVEGVSGHTHLMPDYALGVQAQWCTVLNLPTTTTESLYKQISTLNCSTNF